MVRTGGGVVPDYQRGFGQNVACVVMAVCGIVRKISLNHIGDDFGLAFATGKGFLGVSDIGMVSRLEFLFNDDAAHNVCNLLRMKARTAHSFANNGIGVGERVRMGKLLGGAIEPIHLVLHDLFVAALALSAGLTESFGNITYKQGAEALGSIGTEFCFGHNYLLLALLSHKPRNSSLPSSLLYPSLAISRH